MRRCLPLLVCLACAAVPAAAADDAQSVRTTLEVNIAAMQAEDLQGVLDTIHPDSPVRANTESQLRQLFETYDLQHELVSATYIGTDGEFAYLRAKQRTEKVDGPQFDDNTTESLHLLKQHEGEWKFWYSYTWDVVYGQ